MNVFNGHPLFGMSDPAMPEMLEEFRAYGRPNGDCRGISIAATIALIIGPLEATTFAAIISIGSAVLSAAVAAGLSYAVGYLTRPRLPGGAAAPGAVQPQDGQIVVRQALPERIRSYGTVCVGGATSFQETKSGDLYWEILQGQGEIDSIIAHFIGDTEVLLDGTGNVTVGAPWAGSGKLQIYNALGTADQVCFPVLLTEFAPAVDADFRNRGVPKTLVVYRGVPAEDVGTYYSGGVPPYRNVQQSTLVYDPRDVAQVADGDPDRPRPSNWSFSDNAGLVILDYLRHPDGFKRRAPGVSFRRMIPIAKYYLPEWIDFINLCDEDVALKAGGTEKRYRLCGIYKLTDDPKNVLQAMCDACDAEVYIRGDGTMGIKGGRWDVPDVTIGHKYIDEHSLKPGARKLSAYNRLNIKYTSRDHDFQLVDADIWRDEANIALRGEELTKSIELIWCPSHGQARRIGKVMRARDNPQWQGSVTTKVFGLKAYNRRTLTLEIPELFASASFLRRSYRPSPSLASIEIGVSSLDAIAYAWDPAADEGTAPPLPEDTSQDHEIAAPTAFDLEPGQVDLGGFNGAVLVGTWGAPLSFVLRPEVNWRAVGASDWTSERLASGAQTWTSAVVEDGTDFEARVRWLTPVGRPGAWSATLSITAVANPVAPALPTGLSATLDGGATSIAVDWTNPNSANFFKTEIWRSGDAMFAHASLVHTQFAAPSSVGSYDDGPLSSGDYYYFAIAYNRSGLASAVAGPTPLVTVP